MEGDFWFKTLFSARCVEGTLGSGERLLVQTGFLVQGLLRGVWHLRWDAPEHPPDVPSKATRSLSESLLALAKERALVAPDLFIAARVCRPSFVHGFSKGPKHRAHVQHLQRGPHRLPPLEPVEDFG